VQYAGAVSQIEKSAAIPRPDGRPLACSFKRCHEIVVNNRLSTDCLIPDLGQGRFFKINPVPAVENIVMVGTLKIAADPLTN
jgi:hypothetical protein